METRESAETGNAGNAILTGIAAGGAAACCANLCSAPRLYRPWRFGGNPQVVVVGEQAREAAPGDTGALPGLFLLAAPPPKEDMGR